MMQNQEEAEAEAIYFKHVSNLRTQVLGEALRALSRLPSDANVMDARLKIMELINEQAFSKDTQ